MAVLDLAGHSVLEGASTEQRKTRLLVTQGVCGGAWEPFISLSSETAMFPRRHLRSSQARYHRLAPSCGRALLSLGEPR